MGYREAIDYILTYKEGNLEDLIKDLGNDTVSEFLKRRYIIISQTKWIITKLAEEEKKDTLISRIIKTVLRYLK